MAKEIEELEKLAQQKNQRDEVVNNSEYSGAKDELHYLEKLFEEIEGRKLHNISVS